MQDVINKYSQMPFRYGLDCCQFVGECVESLKGHNPMDAFTYQNKREAHRIIAGYGTLEDAITATLGEPFTGELRTGDITLHDIQDGQQAAGIVFNGYSVVRTPKGVMGWPLEWVRTAWRL